MMESESVSVVAVTFAVGAVVLLIVLMCGFIKKEEDKKDKSGMFYRKEYCTCIVKLHDS